MATLTETICVNENITKEMVDKIIEETPPLARYNSTELLNKNIHHIVRIKPEFWPKLTVGNK